MIEGFCIALALTSREVDMVDGLLLIDPCINTRHHSPHVSINSMIYQQYFPHIVLILLKSLIIKCRHIAIEILCLVSIDPWSSPNILTYHDHHFHATNQSTRHNQHSKDISSH